MLVLQSLRGLSLEVTENMVRDRLNWTRSCGMDVSDKVPDANTLWNFREALIEAEKDTDARWTVKHKKAKAEPDGRKPVDIAIPVYGYKTHISVDKKHGIIRRRTVTDAAANDGKRLARQAASGFRAERHEPGDQFGVDPVRLGESARLFPYDLICAGGSWRASSPTASRRSQSHHSWPPVASKQTKAVLSKAMRSSSAWPASVFGKQNWRLSLRQ